MKIFCIASNVPLEEGAFWFYGEENRDVCFKTSCEAGRDVCFEIEVDRFERSRVIKALVELEAARHYSLPQP